MLSSMSPAPSPKVRGRVLFALAAAALTVVAGCATTAPTSSPSALQQGIKPDGELAQMLAGQVTDAGALTHLQALQKIADQNGGNRASPGPGYDASVEYVAGVLRAEGYDVATPTYEASEDSDDHHDSDDRDTRAAPATLRNVVAQTRTGDPNSVVVIGAHLDSVKEGPGIVDNGSGVATLLEIAGRLGAEPSIRNSVRFAFFGSEEEGSLGSTAYVEGLSAADRQKIMLYLNVDMVASPNAGYFAQGGVGDETSETGPAGSATVAKVLADQLTKTGVTPQIIKFVGDDDKPFIAAGIPTGGAENGDKKKKSAEQAQAWGGDAGVAFDRCYHQACDGLDSVNRVVLDRYLHAIAGTVAYFATSTEPVTG